MVDPSHVHHVVEAGLFDHEAKPLVQTRGVDDNNRHGNISQRLGVIQYKRNWILQSEL